MFKSVFVTLYAMPFRAWQYGQYRPHEAIVYGLVLAALAMISKLLLAMLSMIVVFSGIRGALKIDR